MKRRKTTYADLIDGILTGDADWDRLYSTTGEYEVEIQPAPPNWLISAAEQENQAFGLMWEGNFASAAQQFALLADQVETQDRALSGWYRHWTGFAQERLGQELAAAESYRVAANMRGQLGRPGVPKKGGLSVASSTSPSPQAKRSESVV